MTKYEIIEKLNNFKNCDKFEIVIQKKKGSIGIVDNIPMRIHKREMKIDRKNKIIKIEV